MPVESQTPGYRVTVVAIDQASATLRIDAPETAPLPAELDSPEAFGLLAASLTEPREQTASCALASHVTPEEAHDPDFIRSNSPRFASDAARDEASGLYTLYAASPLLLDHLAPGDAWTYVRVPLPDPPPAPPASSAARPAASGAGVPLQPLTMTPQLQQAIRMLALSRAGLREMVAEAMASNPALGRRDATPPAAPDAPDVVVTRERGAWRARVIGSVLAAVCIAPEAARRYADASLEPDERLRWRDQMREALWLLRALMQRDTTLARVAVALAEHNAGYFERGEPPARPHVREVADAVGMHESTVARIAQDKTIAGPTGALPIAALLKGLPRG